MPVPLIGATVRGADGRNALSLLVCSPLPFRSLHTHVYVVFRTQARQLTQQPIADGDSPIYAVYAFFFNPRKVPSVHGPFSRVPWLEILGCLWWREGKG